MISLAEAKAKLDQIMTGINQPLRMIILQHIMKKWIAEKNQGYQHDYKDYDYENDKTIVIDPDRMLEAIVKKLQMMVLPFCPIKAQDMYKQDYHPYDNQKQKNDIKGLDPFLYDALSIRNFSKYLKSCQRCSFTNQFMIFKCSSFGLITLLELFTQALPDLDGKTVLDIKSRIGSSLYGAYCNSNATKIIGLETNGVYCKLQNEIIKNFDMEDRMKIYQKKLVDCVDLLKTVDVIIVNRIHEHNPDPAEIWQLLKTHVKKGAFIVSRPSIPQALRDAKSQINVDGWVEEVNTIDEGNNDADITVCYKCFSS